MAKITHTEIRMFRMGTGDCFVLKFFAGDKLSYKMMIDCGTWKGSKQHLTPFITELKKYVDNEVDLLVITHEHLDHVHLFDICKDQLTKDFMVKKIWMAWTENDSAKNVQKWQKDYGDKKKALAVAADKLKNAVNNLAYVQRMQNEYNGFAMLGMRKSFADVVSNFSALQMDMDAAGNYIGGLAGMKVVKNEIAQKNIEYHSPGDIITNIPGLDGIKFFVLGPPLVWEEIKVETGGIGESYDHNKELAEGQAFADAVLASPSNTEVLPFEKDYELAGSSTNNSLAYNNPSLEWRRIDNDWLNSAGSLALRINSITNNLSLALAIEFEESGRVMLFPGDAEYGSWESWHDIKWEEKSRNKEAKLTEDLLNRTVFYKVAHHLSHHGTAERLGMEMMTNPDLVSMATLDYSVISPTWKNTMPNRALLKALVSQTKGRLLVMDLNGLFYDTRNTIKLEDKINSERKKMSAKEAKDFKNASVEDEPMYLQFTVKG